MGPLRLKRLQKDQASHGIALDTPHAYILKKKKLAKNGTPKFGFWVRNGPKMAENDPNAYNLHEVKLFDQLSSTLHVFLDAKTNLDKNDRNALNLQKWP